MNIYKKEFLNYQEKIKSIKNNINASLLDDEDYNKYWYSLNNDYKYLMIYLIKYLNRYECLKLNEYGLKTDEYLKLLSYVKKAYNIGLKTGYYMNKHSKRLVFNLKLDYFNLNQKDYIIKEVVLNE